jgi:putative hydrolase of the HAD superfamily
MIFFDLDGTLLDHDAAERRGAQAFAAVFGLEESGFLARWREVSGRHIDRFLAGEIDFAEQRRLRVREVLGRELTNDEADDVSKVYLDAYESGWRLYPDVLPCLIRLEGARLGVITNGNREQQLKKLEVMSIRGRFALIVTSDDAGAAKPDSDIFRVACGRAGVPPETSTYIGDRLNTDARAATRAGLRGIWLDRAANNPDVDNVEVIHSLIELHRKLATTGAPGR